MKPPSENSINYEDDDLDEDHDVDYEEDCV